MGRKKPNQHSFKPTLILHGGAGAITRANLPPDLYRQYHKSLLSYLESTKSRLDDGMSALDAACYAVSLMEDDPLFNCGRGSVFTKDGTIEMEASVMVASISERGPPQGSIKRAAAVSLIRKTRHPILLAKEVLVDADASGGLGGTSTMHCHLSGPELETWGHERGLELKGKDWFWTKRRWDEHRRGLKPEEIPAAETDSNSEQELALPSQGTVGAVCLDADGNLAVATSTGGLTNKAPGRIGDTPSVGAGFWAESWNEDSKQKVTGNMWIDGFQNLKQRLSTLTTSCIPQLRTVLSGDSTTSPLLPDLSYLSVYADWPRARRRVVAMSGTGNGDSFLRTNAARSTAAVCRYSSNRTSLAEAVTNIAGPNGELQRSAGERWNRTGEGQGGMIGIEISNRPSEGRLGVANVIFDFNCGGLWRAYYQIGSGGEVIPKIMVFRDEY